MSEGEKSLLSLPSFCLLTYFLSFFLSPSFIIQPPTTTSQSLDFWTVRTPIQFTCTQFVIIRYPLHIRKCRLSQSCKFPLGWRETSILAFSISNSRNDEKNERTVQKHTRTRTNWLESNWEGEFSDRINYIWNTRGSNLQTTTITTLTFNNLEVHQLSIREDKDWSNFFPHCCAASQKYLNTTGDRPFYHSLHTKRLDSTPVYPHIRVCQVIPILQSPT